MQTLQNQINPEYKVETTKKEVIVNNAEGKRLFSQNPKGIFFNPNNLKARNAAAKQAIRTHPNGVTVEVRDKKIKKIWLMHLMKEGMELNKIKVKNKKGELITADELYPELKKEEKKQVLSPDQYDKIGSVLD